MMFVWRLRGKIIRTDVCCMCCVRQLYTMMCVCHRWQYCI